MCDCESTGAVGVEHFHGGSVTAALRNSSLDVPVLLHEC